MLKLLLDENIGHEAFRVLLDLGYAVKSILKDAPGSSDENVLAQAEREEMILVTLDRDFGRLVFLKSHKHVGVIYLKLQNESAALITQVLISLLTSYADRLAGSFTVVSERSVRIKESKSFI